MGEFLVSRGKVVRSPLGFWVERRCSLCVYVVIQFSRGIRVSIGFTSCELVSVVIVVVVCSVYFILPV